MHYVNVTYVKPHFELLLVPFPSLLCSPTKERYLLSQILYTIYMQDILHCDVFVPSTHISCFIYIFIHVFASVQIWYFYAFLVQLHGLSLCSAFREGLIP